jgi:spore germination protein KB
MNRFFYYIIIMNMLSNVIAYVPTILIHERFDGAVLSILLSIPIGILFILSFMKLLSKFPGEGLPEILNNTLPKIVAAPALFSFLILFVGARMIELITFTEIIRLYVNQEYSQVYLMLMFIVVTCIGVLLPPERMMYLLELILIINTPFLIFIVFKAIFNEGLNFNDIMNVATYVTKPPTYLSLSTATYTFSGYANMAIYNRAYAKPVSLKFLWVIGIIGTLNFFTSIFIPIGTLGFADVGNYIYPWVTTADSMVFKYGFVERVLYLFVLVYISITMMNVLFHWHVSIELVKGLFPKKDFKLKVNPVTVCSLLVFIIITFVLQAYLDDQTAFVLGKWWIMIRWPGEFLTIVLLFLAVRRRKKKIE